MTRTLLLLLMLLFAAPTFAQTKQSAPSTQEQLMELRLNQQQLEKKLEDQKSDLEEKFEVKKENLSYQKEDTNGWIALLAMVVTVIGVVLPIVMFFMGKKIVADVDRQMKESKQELKKWNKWVDKKKNKIDEKCREMDLLINNKKKLLDDSFNELMNNASDFNKKYDLIKVDKKESSIDKELSNQAKKIAESSDASPFQKDMAKAMELYYTKDYDSCIKQHLMILDKYKKELTLDLLPYFYFRMATASEQLKDNDNAIEYLKKVLALDSSNCRVYSLLGYLYDKKNAYDLAIDMYDKAIELKPSFAEVWFFQGSTYTQKEEYDTAISKYNEAIRLKPDFAEAWCLLGNAYLSKGDEETAIKKCSEAIRLKPKFAKAWHLLGNAYLKKGEYGKAIEKYSKAVELKPDDAEVWFNLGNAYNAKGEYGTAIEKYRKAIELKPEHSLTLTNYAELQIVLNQDVRENLTKLEGAAKIKNEIFNYHLLNTIYQKTQGSNHGTAEDAFNQLTQTVGGDASKVTWNFDILRKWIGREASDPMAPSSDVRDFVAELIKLIEDWRNTKTE